MRGRKVVSSLLRNEPRYLDLIVDSLERYASDHEQWQVHYTLLLWLSHLLLTPFNLESISLTSEAVRLPAELKLKQELPDLAHRSLSICLQLMRSSAISREVATLTLVRLCGRPDMQKLELADALVDWCLTRLNTVSTDITADLHAQLGVMHFLAGLAKSADLDFLLPKILRACERLNTSETPHAITTDAVGRKLLIKTMSMVMMTSLRAVRTSETLARFLSESSALEVTIETQLQCLADRESLVRHTAAKATSNIMLALDASMAREVLEALFSVLHDDMASSAAGIETQNANAFAWHGIVLALSYALFKRSVPADQLPILLDILLTALTFRQRTATGSVTGTNVRDAANFGLWSLARRSTTAELSRVELSNATQSVIRSIAIHLLQSSCLDPVGNIRRGSSAALQELVGRHPNEVPHGIDLVQVVDFVAVGLRQRAMINVAASAMALDPLYFDALVDGLIGWRGLGSSDSASREHAATSLVAQAVAANDVTALQLITKLLVSFRQCRDQDFETLHGIVLSLAMWIDDLAETTPFALTEEQQVEQLQQVWNELVSKNIFTYTWDSRALRTNLTSAIFKLFTAMCTYDAVNFTVGETAPSMPTILQPLLDQLLGRSDNVLLEIVPDLIRALLLNNDVANQYQCLEPSCLRKELEIHVTKPILHGAARAFAIAASVNHVSPDAVSTEHIVALQIACKSAYVDWRIIGFKAMRTIADSWSGRKALKPEHILLIVDILAAGMRDFTIDQRGDIGSLVRIEALNCANVLCTAKEFQQYQELLVDLHTSIARLSLEKLNRVRTRAAQCRAQLSGVLSLTCQSDDVDSEDYFACAMAPLWQGDSPSWVRKALLSGIPSCAGTAAEHLTQNSRAVLCKVLSSVDIDILQQFVEGFLELLVTATADSHNIVPILEVIDYLLQAGILQRLVDTDFKWRRLLAQIQKAHYKSTDVPRLLVALSVYSWLAYIPGIRQDVLKKLFSMLKTIPYPKVRAATADALFLATVDEALRGSDWHLPAKENSQVLIEVYDRHITT